mmetsp:Transcript_81847/g.181938  ORF Transcript_81847/g.181938 Transcript_81847/m.181938 type:complete len:139 (+) Transcript_81847:3-419(+)
MVHVTPQENCSYASFETNYGSVRGDGFALEGSDVGDRVGALIGRVLDVFRPRKLTVTLFTDQGAAGAIGEKPFGAALDRKYKRRMCTSTYFEQDYSAIIANFEVAVPAELAGNGRKRPSEDAGSQAESLARPCKSQTT